MDKLEWNTSLFNDLDKYWQEIADARPTEIEANFVEAEVRTNGLILDLCCGTGRHSILLAKKGLNIVGLDISPNLLRIAKAKIVENNSDISLVRAEMQYLPFKTETFASIINMFTSFGYLPSKKEDMKCLKEIARTLRKNGKFLLDVVNREHLLKVFKNKDWGEYPSFFMLERRVLDTRNSRIDSQWVLVDKKTGNTKTFQHNLRLYFPSELKKMLEKAEFEVKEIYGDYSRDEEFRKGSSRLIILAIK